jgi:hypothetical protein
VEAAYRDPTIIAQSSSKKGNGGAKQSASRRRLRFANVVLPIDQVALSATFLG